MTINLPNAIQDIYTVGDVHGSLNLITYKIRQHKIQNSVFIFCGDVGIGFEKLEHYTNTIMPELHKTLKKYNNVFLFVRGNHDDPRYFEEQLINTQYVKCIPDYTILNICNLNILCIGGAISIDRSFRIQNDSVRIVDYMKYHNCDYNTASKKCIKSYWENEPIKYREKVLKPINMICSHTAPSFCFPNDKGGIVTDFAAYDLELIKDIDDERRIMDRVYEDYKNEVTHWYYGHFHKTMSQKINNTLFKLLDIGELCRHVSYDYDLL